MLFYRCAAALALGTTALSGVGAESVDAKPTLPSKMSITELAPSKLVPDLCVFRYRISTTSPECQAYFDQGLGYFYSYVWMEAARSFETALQYDVECPMAWWGLSRALERWGKLNHRDTLVKASKLQTRANYREQQLILASMQEKEDTPAAGDEEARKRKAIATIDNLIALYDEDEEAWYFRAQLAGGSGLNGGQLSSVPFYKALLRINPLHPGANHELIHYYENAERPALGWIHAENFIKSSPGIPHAFHMQAHLAMRLGKWAKTTDRSVHAIELQRAYHKEMKVKPHDDHQYDHHLETLLCALVHDGRFTEARAIQSEQRACGYESRLVWFRLHLAERDWAEARKVLDTFRIANPNDKGTSAYLSALLYLKQGDPIRTLPEIRVLQDDLRERPEDTTLQFRLWETHGWYLCQTGAADEGLKMLARLVAKTKDSYDHHAWGNGAYHMEMWGIAALQVGRESCAEEAFLEALAHDPGSVRAALGMQVLCEHQRRTEEAKHFADIARGSWKRASRASLTAELDALRSAHNAAAEKPKKRSK